ncbi:MAG: class I SAM-dependent methyltransferase [Candidatus Methanomethyliaceae archaeon]
MVRVMRLLKGSHRVERLNALLEIWLNRRVIGDKPPDSECLSFEEFVSSVARLRPHLAGLVGPGGEGEAAVEYVTQHFRDRTGPVVLPFPAYFNADRSLALLCYALARYLKPVVVLETGVGYGVSSALFLLALERNGTGRLISIDLPPLSDPRGRFTGFAVPENLRTRWSLYRGTSRRWLPRIVPECPSLDLCLLDSANVYTLQRYEFSLVWPRLTPGGAVLVNNVTDRFVSYTKSFGDAELWVVRQVEKPSCATVVAFKRRQS